MTPADKDREYWRKHREDMVRKELIRQGKIPNFIMTDGSPKLEIPIEKRPRPRFSLTLKIVVWLILAAFIAWIYS